MRNSKLEIFEAAANFEPLLIVTMDAGSGVMSIEELQAEIDALTAEAEEIVTGHEAAGTDMPADDEMRLEEIEASLKKFNRILAVKRRIVEARAAGVSTGRRTTSDSNSSARRGTAIPAEPKNADEDRRHGFQNFGEFAVTVGCAYRRDEAKASSALTRLQNVATTFNTESAGGEGGYLVPPEFREQIWRKVMGEGSLLSRASQIVTMRNNVSLPKDETTPWQSSGGIQAYWEGEADQFTASKAKFETVQARLSKLTALVNVSSELLEDAPALDSYLRLKAPEKMGAKVNTAVIRGTGAGQPQGILNAASLITVSKEASQDAETITMNNINDMWNRLYAEWRANSVWLINQEIEPMIEGMAFQPSAPVAGATQQTAYSPVYMPVGGLADSPYGRLKGRPVMPMQPCSQLGTIGDIILVDMAQYLALTKGRDVQTDVSIHLYFDQDLETYRFIMRLHGLPGWSTVITPENGSNTYSWAVALETRS